MPKLSIAELFDLRGEVAIVTGAAQGIGRAIAERLAEAGAAVLLAGHNPVGLKDACDTIARAGGTAAWLECDVCRNSDLDAIVATARRQYGPTTILVNAVGGMHSFTPTVEVQEEVFDATISRNLKSNYLLSQKVARDMIAAKNGGRIINIASISGIRPDPLLAAYNASKAGVIALTRSLGTELAPHRILVNAVAPGPIMTPNTERAYALPKVQKLVRMRVPLGHVGDPEDIGNAVLFLASKAAANMTASVMVVDGGMTQA